MMLWVICADSGRLLVMMKKMLIMKLKDDYQLKQIDLVC